MKLNYMGGSIEVTNNTFSRRRSWLGVIALGAGSLFVTTEVEAQNGKRQMGEPFLTVFSLAGKGDQWWVAEYDHPADWFITAWRDELVSIGENGIRFDLAPTSKDKRVSTEEMKKDDGTLVSEGKTSKGFTSGQVQRRKWYGYGRYEIVMRPASGDGLISAFYLYTGPHFGDPHEEIDIEFLGRDTSKVYLNRFRDGQQLDEPIHADLGFDASERSHLYAFEWSEDTLIWYAGDTEIFRLTGASDIPRPPAKIYLDLWAGGPGQANWSGQAPETISGNALVQCASFSPTDRETPQCSDLVAGE